jgi:hypothetical protein
MRRDPCNPVLGCCSHSGQLGPSPSLQRASQHTSQHTYQFVRGSRTHAFPGGHPSLLHPPQISTGATHIKLCPPDRGSTTHTVGPGHWNAGGQSPGPLGASCGCSGCGACAGGGRVDDDPGSLGQGLGASKFGTQMPMHLPRFWKSVHLLSSFLQYFVPGQPGRPPAQGGYSLLAEVGRPPPALPFAGHCCKDSCVSPRKTTRPQIISLSRCTDCNLYRALSPALDPAVNGGLV